MTLCKPIKEFFKQYILSNLFDRVLIISFGVYNKNKVQSSLILGCFILSILRVVREPSLGKSLKWVNKTPSILEMQGSTHLVGYFNFIIQRILN